MAYSHQSDDLAECPECGGTAISGDTPCSRCQEPDGDYADDRCQNCGGHVSETFRRVLGDNNDVAHACPDCTSQTDHFHGAVAGKDVENTPGVYR